MNTHEEFPITLSGTGASTLMWARPHEVEQMALDQLRRISQLPWVHGVRVMPDVHVGSGACIGSVIGMVDAVAPSAVGVDIGCGMIAVKTSLTLTDLPDNLAPLRLAIEAAVPVGFNANDGQAPIIRQDQKINSEFTRLFSQFGSLRAEKIADREGRAMNQCGSLGGGNHFIEVTSDENENIWLMLHSGSRNIGKELAERHISTAKILDHNVAVKAGDLSVFLSGTPEMDAYRNDLYWAQEYARVNREIMMATVRKVMENYFPDVTFSTAINCHHNYVKEETIDGQPLIVTRKGAISARNGEYGLIPGSMGTGSYVVKGLGNETGYFSASHGAGRKMSRSKAKKMFTTKDLADQTRGVECRKDQGVVDEIPGAYKDLESVIAAQVDLVEVEARLTTLLCVKG